MVQTVKLADALSAQEIHSVFNLHPASENDSGQLYFASPSPARPPSPPASGSEAGGVAASARPLLHPPSPPGEAGERDSYSLRAGFQKNEPGARAWDADEAGTGNTQTKAEQVQKQDSISCHDEDTDTSDPNHIMGGGSYTPSANNSNNNSNIPTNGAGPAIMPTTTSGTMLSNDGGGGGEDGASTNEESSEERAALFAQLLRVPLPATYECLGVSRGGAKPASCAVHREATIEAEKIGLFWSVLKLETPHELRICWRSIVS